MKKTLLELFDGFFIFHPLRYQPLKKKKSSLLLRRPAIIKIYIPDNKHLFTCPINLQIVLFKLAVPFTETVTNGG